MFAHLHVHTEYSLLDGMSRIPQIVARAKELGMDSLAITDHGVLYGAIQFYYACRQAGIKPIIGCEVYVAPGSRLKRDPRDKNHYHLVLLARNQQGYRNLMQLTSKAHLEGFYYRPRVDRELLSQHREGLIALSACTSGEVSRLISGGRAQEAREAAQWYRETFGDFYLEIQRQPIAGLEEVNQGLISLGRELGIPLVATNDVHYVSREDAPAHDLLLCIGTNSSVSDEKRMKMAGDFFYLTSPQEIAAQFADLPEAIENSGRIAAMCDLSLESGRLHLPEIELPAGKTADEYLADLCYEGLRIYYPQPTPEIEQRLKYELEVIRETQFANYFLVVWDIISFARKSGILFGVRGSAAASIALRCLGMTEVDPIRHRLVFERFLNVERKEMPDIDLDFEDGRRDEVIAYVTAKYGPDHVAQIITFGTLGARAALRDVGRALGMTYSDVDRVARLVPFSPNMTLERALNENAELRAIYQQDAIVSKLVDSARQIEGISRHASTHAAGLVISREPLASHVPLQRVSKGGEEGGVMTQYTMEDIARIGLLKMDVLGLRNLTILGKARQIIRDERGIDIELYRLPMEDPATFALLASGETAGVFQLEGAGMRRYIKELQPTSFSDITAMIALYRPGPMEHIPTYIKAKHDPSLIKYPHPALAPILEETYGVIVYQEQVLFIVQALAGYRLGQADIFRKAMGKKIPEVMKKEKRSFIAGAVKNGFSTEVAEAVFALIEPFSGYAFNKAHATSYALIAYQTAYLKANFKVEYMTAYLTSHTGELEKTASAVAECRRLGITVLPPDINHSQISFSIDKDDHGAAAVRFGLAAIKNVGVGALEPIISERKKGGEFKSIEDLCRRANLSGTNRRVMESLVKAGALDGLGERGTLLASVGRIMALAQREQNLRETGQTTMFDLFGAATSVPLPELELTPAPESAREKAAWEKELLGVGFSEKPFEAAVGDPRVTFCGQIDQELNGQTVICAGRVIAVRTLLSREGKSFAAATLEDVSGSIEVMVWPKAYEATAELWQEGSEVEVQGKVRVKDDRVQLSGDLARPYRPPEPVSPPSKAESLIQVPPPPAPAAGNLVISIAQTADPGRDISTLDRLVSILREHPGEEPACLAVSNGDKIVHLKLADPVKCSPELRQRLAALVGEENIRYEVPG